MNHEKRLNSLERVWPPPAPPPPRYPVRWEWLTEEELETYAECEAAMSAVDVGPIRLDERADFRARLDGLSDGQLERLTVLTRKIQALQQEGTTA